MKSMRSPMMSQGRCVAIVHSLFSILPSPLLLFPFLFVPTLSLFDPLSHPLSSSVCRSLSSLLFRIPFQPLPYPTPQRSLPPLSSLNSFPPPLPFPSSSRLPPSPCSLFILSPIPLILHPCPLHHSPPYRPYPLLFLTFPSPSHPFSPSPIATPLVIAPLFSSPFFPLSVPFLIPIPKPRSPFLRIL